MNTSIESTKLNELAKRIAIVRISFGLIWIVDVFLKFQPAFYNGILQMIRSRGEGQPSWLNPWFQAWYHIIGFNPHFFAYLIILVEILTTLSLLFGLVRHLNYLLGAIFSFLIWSVGEGFGGPYVSGTTDINAGLIYCLVYLLLYSSDNITNPYYSLDPLLSKKILVFKKKFIKSKNKSIILKNT